MDLDHLAIVPRPGHSWAGVVATALDGVDVVLLRLPFPARPAMARNLAARARERRAVLVVLAGERAWEGPDLLFRVEEGAWAGLGEGYGHLRTRRATVMAVGRRAAARPVRCRLWLPGPSGAVVPEMALDPDVPEGVLERPEGMVDPAVQHGAVHPATARHPAAMAVVSGALSLRTTRRPRQVRRGALPGHLVPRPARAERAGPRAKGFRPGGGGGLVPRHTDRDSAPGSLRRTHPRPFAVFRRGPVAV